MYNYRYIYKSTLQVGDYVGIPVRVSIGWGNFRYDYVETKQIARITPARTKFVMTDGEEYSNRTSFVDIDKEIDKRNAVVKCAQNIYSKKYSVAKEIDEKLCRELSDKQIAEISKYINCIEATLKQND